MNDRSSIRSYEGLHIPSGVPFRLAASPGRGWGAFATRKIAAGSVIAREAALFTISKPHALIEDRDIRAALSTLPPGSRQQFYSLRDNGDAKFHYLIDAFCENCFRVPSSSSVTYDSAHGFGCYILLSRINHSCIPNAKIPDSNIEGTSIACFATRDIEEGEEITFCYNTDFMCRTSRDRHHNITIVEEIMTKKAWDERLGACLRLWGRVDAGDEALRSQLKRIDSMRR
ncbi:hypothetical protein N0V87_010556 [Didymella glomerata]|uniref:SET domain-containing protein n=1 Tax=Didymella glomerata TaxID=749621 RepID=A0A9W8WP25_9PLEO|nr:hypothetical protein N0V87_010556 [Didymella glomerata]